MNAHELEEVVMAVVRNRLGDARIVSMEIEDDYDETGEPILRVRVVYEEGNGRLNPGRLSGLLRSLRPALSDKGESRFPVMSFISKSDAESIAGAA